MSHRIAAAAVLFLCAGLASPDQSLYEEYREYALRVDPFMVTQSRDYRFNDRVPDVSEAALRARLLQLREFHDVVLTSGGVPLDLLKIMVSQYIEEARER